MNGDWHSEQKGNESKLHSERSSLENREIRIFPINMLEERVISFKKIENVAYSFAALQDNERLKAIKNNAINSIDGN